MVLVEAVEWPLELRGLVQPWEVQQQLVLREVLLQLVRGSLQALWPWLILGHPYQYGTKQLQLP